MEEFQPSPSGMICRIEPQARPGFTLLEIVVAIVLLGIGSLGYATVTANVARAIRTDAIRSRSAELLYSRLEILRRQGCGGLTSGVESQQGVTVSWSSAQVGMQSRAVIVTATRPATSYNRTDSLQALFACE